MQEIEEFELAQLKETVDYLEKQHRVYVQLLEKLAEIIFENIDCTEDDDKAVLELLKYL